MNRKHTAKNIFAAGFNCAQAVFASENSSYPYRDLLGCDVGTPKGLAEINELRLHDKVCLKAVFSAVSTAEKMI